MCVLPPPLKAGGLFCVKLCQDFFAAFLKQMIANKNAVIAYVNDIHLYNVVRFCLFHFATFFYFVFSLNRFEEWTQVEDKLEFVKDFCRKFRFSCENNEQKATKNLELIEKTYQ